MAECADSFSSQAAFALLTANTLGGTPHPYPCDESFSEYYISFEQRLKTSPGGLITAIYGIPEFLMKVAVKRHDLHKQHGGKLIHRVHPEEGAGGAIPKKLSHDAMILLPGCRGPRSYCEINSKSYRAFAGKPHTFGNAVGEVVGGHQPYRSFL